MQNKRDIIKKKKKKEKTSLHAIVSLCYHLCDNMEIGLIDSSVNIAEEQISEAKLYSKDI